MTQGCEFQEVRTLGVNLKAASGSYCYFSLQMQRTSLCFCYLLLYIFPLNDRIPLQRSRLEEKKASITFPVTNSLMYHSNKHRRLLCPLQGRHGPSWVLQPARMFSFLEHRHNYPCKLSLHQAVNVRLHLSFQFPSDLASLPFEWPFRRSNNPQGP